MPKQCETENVATACSPAGAATGGASGSMASRPWVTSWMSSSPWRSASAVSAATSSAVGQRAVGVARVDEADRPRARRDRRRHRVGVEAIAALGADGHGHRDAAGREHRGGQVEVAGVAEDDLVAGVDGGQQRQRQPGLGALGADDLEARRRARGRARAPPPRAAARSGRAGRRRARRARARRASPPGPTRAARGSTSASRGRPSRRAGAWFPRDRASSASPADQRDGVAVGDVVPHRVVAGLQRGQAPRADRAAAPAGAHVSTLVMPPSSSRTSRTTR